MPWKYPWKSRLWPGSSLQLGHPVVWVSGRCLSLRGPAAIETYRDHHGGARCRCDPLGPLTRSVSAGGWLGGGRATSPPARTDFSGWKQLLGCVAQGWSSSPGSCVPTEQDKLGFGTQLQEFWSSGARNSCPSPEAFPSAGREERIFSSNLYVLLGISTGVGERLEMPHAHSQANTGCTSRREDE